MIERLAAAARAHRWIWSAIGVLILWAALGTITERFSLHSLTGVVTSASFLAVAALGQTLVVTTGRGNIDRSEEHTSELQSLMRISYAVFCLKKKKHKQQ